MVLYTDDFVILCPTAEEALMALEEIKAWVEANGLTLHPDKTHVGDCRLDGQGFDFLGYRIEAGKRWVRKKSLMAVKDKIRSVTRRTRGDSLVRIITDLNPRLIGWFGYLKPPYSEIATVDLKTRQTVWRQRPSVHAKRRRWLPDCLWVTGQRRICACAVGVHSASQG